MSNATFTMLRELFIRKVEDYTERMRPVPAPEAIIQHPQVYWDNYRASLSLIEDQARIRAYNDVVMAAAHALGTQDALKAGAVVRRAGIKYEPAREWVIDGPTEDTEVVVRKPATAYIK